MNYVIDCMMDPHILPYKFTEKFIDECVIAVIWDQNESVVLVDHSDRGFWFPFKNKSKDESTLDVAKKIVDVSDN
jgi:hypothetical protein